MKKLLATLALAAPASPAFAATHHVRHTTSDAMSAYALANSGYVSSDPNAVVFDNKVIGSDPDPNVRLEIRRELPGYAD